MRWLKFLGACVIVTGVCALCLPANTVLGSLIVLDDDGDRDTVAGPNVTTFQFSDHNNGGWGSAAQYFNQTNAYNGGVAPPHNGGSPGPGTATYVIDASLGLIAGATYDVYATWPQQGQANLGLATYAVSDGLGAVVVDQTLAVSPDVQVLDPFVGDMKNFQLLGQVVDDGDGIITMVLSSDGSNFVIADAVAVNLVPEPGTFALCGLAILGLAAWKRRS